uniref:Uncharacterized protein n=1 Tax=Panagrolaimus davidi TaxID=227884 RepID=A0A914PBD2_9BILA
MFSSLDYGDEYDEVKESSNHQVQWQEIFSYLVHALPYTQSAFNWLFYAFLNHNLRHSSRCSLGARSNATNIGGDNLPTSATGSMVPLWKNLQNVGSYLKTASIDTGNTLLRHSPFRSRSRIRSRSTTCLGSIIDTPTPAPASNGFLSINGDGSTFYTSMIDLPINEQLRCEAAVNDSIQAKLGSSRSACALQSNSFSPKPTPDFPLLGFPPARSSSPIRLSAPISLRVPSNSPWSISEASSSSINIGMSTPSTAPISPQDGLNPTIETCVEWL